MQFQMIHQNFNVKNLAESLAFYEKALGMTVARVKEASDGSFKLTFLTDAEGIHQIELTWLRDWDRPYNLGDNEFHMAFVVDDYEEAHELHKEMGCICFENESMGLYFINDPDGYWIEIIPEHR